MQQVIFTIGTLDFDFPDFTVLNGGGIQKALKQLQQGAPPDIIAINAICENQSALSIIRNIRKTPRYKHIPIIIFYTNWDSIDRIRAFEAGANEALPIACNQAEISLRLKSLLRQQSWPLLKEKREDYEDITLLPDQMKFEIDNIQYRLTSKEFFLLRLLLQKRGFLLPRERIFQKVWQDNSSQLRVVDTYIKRIRKKLGPLGDQIETVHGTGYRFQPAKNI